MGAGLQRAARATKRTRYPGTPEVAPGQVWEDCDKRVAEERFEKRQVKVLRIVKLSAGDYAVCKVLTTHTAGREVAIKLRRFFPTSTGYRYLRTED